MKRESTKDIHPFAEGLIDADEMEYTRLNQISRSDVPSLELTQRVQKTIKGSSDESQFEGYHKHLPRAASWLIIGIVTLLLAVPSSALLREWVFGLKEESNPGQIRYYLEKLNNEEAREPVAHSLLEREYVPKYMPADMKLTQDYSDSSKQIRTYRSADRTKMLSVAVFDQSIEQIALDTLDADVVQTTETILGQEASFISQNNMNFLVWTYDNYLFMVNGTLTKEEILQISQSIFE